MMRPASAAPSGVDMTRRRSCTSCAVLPDFGLLRGLLERLAAVAAREQLQQTLPVGRAQHGLQRVGVLPQPVGQFLLVHGAPPAFLSMGQYMPRRRKT